MASAIQRAEICESFSGLGGIEWFPEATGQSYKAGQAVYLVNGLVTVVAANTDQKVLGLVMMDAGGTATTTKTVPVFVMRPGVKARMSAYHVTPGSAITAYANVGTATQIKQQSNKTVVDVANIGANAASVFIITGYEGTVGEAYGRYIVEIAASHFQFNS